MEFSPIQSLAMNCEQCIVPSFSYCVSIGMLLLILINSYYYQVESLIAVQLITTIATYFLYHGLLSVCLSDKFLHPV